MVRELLVVFKEYIFGPLIILIIKKNNQMDFVSHTIKEHAMSITLDYGILRLQMSFPGDRN